MFLFLSTDWCFLFMWFPSSSRQLPVPAPVDVAEMLEHEPEFGAQPAVP